MERGAPVVQGHAYFGWHREFMIRAVNVEVAMNANGGFTLGSNAAVNVIRAKCDFRIACALQDFAVHFPIAHAAAALATPGIHNDFPSQLAGHRIEMQVASL